MQVVLLAAGRGERFADVGPKLMLEVAGVPMITRALRQASEISKKPVVVCLEDQQGDFAFATPPEVDPTFVPLRYVQQGAAMSLLAVQGQLLDNVPVLVMDCDTVYVPNVLTRFVQFSLAAFGQKYDSTLLCFRPSDESERYSFAKTTGKGKFPLVTQVVEKVRISDTATCGVHCFSSWAVARQAVYEMVILRTLTKGEYYLAPAHNNLPRTTMMLITPAEFQHVGTPAELAAYEAVKA